MLESSHSESTVSVGTYAVVTIKLRKYFGDTKSIIKLNNIILQLIYLYFPPSSHLIYISTRPVENVITTKGLQDRNIHILDGTTVENKGKLILNEIFPSVQKRDI